MPAARDHVKTIFGQAAEIASPADRSHFLDEACSGDHALRAEVEDLLASMSQAGDFLVPCHFTDQTLDSKLPERSGSRIGPYKLLQQIGEGGFGVVYMAEQQEPVQRRVALKIIKPGMDTRQVIARFEAERQALALMDHPNIAKVLDAGTTGEGTSSQEPGTRDRLATGHWQLGAASRPFFVMELVKGTPMTKYCDEKHLNLRQRLELMIPVCQAIQHAHQKGIIHRDIKPSNVLIAQYDGRPVPKVIDFGVAKATAQKLTERTMFTELGQVVGTIEYMSPEQAELNQLDIDTRSDIYSLGVLLYELLTGSTPFEERKLRTIAFHEMLRIIREEEPPKPSARLSTIDTLPSVAASRGIDAARLTKTIRGELDWIVMKCLEKDRERRYETANSLAADLQHYLQDEAVIACPPSHLYRLRKFYRKHKASLLSAMLVAGALIVACEVSIWQAHRAKSAERVAQRLYIDAQTSASLASAAAADERKARQSEAAERKRAEKEEKTAKEAAAKAAKAEADAKQAAAEAQAILNFFQDNVLLAARRKEDGGLGREVTLRAAINAAESKIETSFKDRPLVEAPLRRVLGATYINLFEPNLAIQQLERSQALFKEHRGPDHNDTLAATYELGNAYWIGRKTKQVVQLCEDLVPRAEAKYGPSHTNTVKAKNQLAIAYRISGDTTKGVALHEQLLELAKANRGARDFETLTLMNNVADGYIELKRYDDAIRLLEECVELGEAKSSGAAADRRHAWHIEKLATTYLRVNNFDKAIRLSEKAWHHEKATLGPADISTLQLQTHLGWVYARAGEMDTAESHFVEVLKTLRSVITEPDRKNPAVLTIPARIAGTLIEQKRYVEAESLLREFQVSDDRTGTVTGRKPLLALALLGQAQDLKSTDPSAAERKLAEAQPLLLASYESTKNTLAKTLAFPESDRGLHLSNFNRELTEIIQQLVDLYTTWNKPDEAAKWQTQLDAMRGEQSK